MVDCLFMFLQTDSLIHNERRIQMNHIFDVDNVAVVEPLGCKGCDGYCDSSGCSNNCDTSCYATCDGECYGFAK